MKARDTQKLLIQISSDVAAIKQHLNDMNGKLVKHERSLDACPEKHKELDKCIGELRQEITVEKTKSSVYIGIASGVLGALLIVGLNIILNYLKLR